MERQTVETGVIGYVKVAARVVKATGQGILL